MRAKHLIFAVISTALAFTCLVPAQIRLDAQSQRQFDEQLLYLPNERLLNHFTGGLSSVVADVLWLQCIQYTSRHFRGDGKFKWLNHMCNTITRLDPNFVDVYRYGGVFLASLQADDDAGIDLLQRGMIQNPDRWELPYETAAVYLLNRRDQPDCHEKAAYYLALAVATGTAPEFVTQFANDLQRRYDLGNIERDMWRSMAENSPDRIMRDMARRKLVELDLRDNCRALNEILTVFEEQQGRRARTLDDLVAAGLLPRIPHDPLGGRYFLEADGVAKNTTLLDEDVARRLNRLQAGIDAFRKRTGDWPESLQGAYQAGDLLFVPPHPYATREWQYDPTTGEVRE